MKFFIGIVPPVEISQAIHAIQKAHGDNRTEPHITLRPPVALTQQDAWLEAIRIVAASTAPFPVQLTHTGWFGKRVLFIHAEAHALQSLEKQLVKAISAFELPTHYQNQSYHPHLTLGRTNVGFTSSSLLQMERLAQQLLVQPLAFTVNFLRVYHQPITTERYKVYEDVWLQ